MLGNLLLIQAEVFEIKDIPQSFNTKFNKAIKEKTAKYLHWCGKMGGQYKDMEENDRKTLAEDFFWLVGDYTDYFKGKGVDNQ